MPVSKNTLDNFLNLFETGVSIENFPQVILAVYLDVSKKKHLSPEAVSARCVQVINSIIDNTNSGENDEKLDAAMKKMVPGLVETFIALRPQQCLSRCFA